MTNEPSEQLGELVRATDRYRHAMARALGIGVRESAALAVLLRHASTTASELSRTMLLSPDDATAALDRLDSAGYTMRHQLPGAGSEAVTELTLPGRRAADLLERLFELDISSAIPDIDPGRMRALAEALHVVTTQFLAHTATSHHSTEPAVAVPAEATARAMPGGDPPR